MDNEHWGQHLILKLVDCNPDYIRDPQRILAWVRELVAGIDMKAYGEPILEHFANDNPDTGGYTLIQLIETSNIAAHFAEKRNAVFIDVFSCKEFDNDIAIGICQRFFEPVRIDEDLKYR